MNAVSVDILKVQDCPDIAELHLANLRSPWSGRPGRELLACNYRAIAKQVGACGYVARKDGQIIGFVCGVWQPAALHRTLFKREWFRLIWWLGIQILYKPRLALDFLANIRTLTKESENLNVRYELRPIVVCPAARGSGAANLLLNKLLEDSARRGFSRIFLFTEDDNFAAQAFYKKTGFVQVGKQSRSGTVHLRYERNVITGAYES